MTVLVGVWSIQLLQWCVCLFVYYIYIYVCVCVMCVNIHLPAMYVDHAVQRHRNLHFSREALPIFVARM